MKFHRYGDLTAANYSEVIKRSPNAFHTPPKKKGIFAFPENIDDAFFWAWKFQWREELSENENTKLFQDWRRRIRKRFEYDGLIWHHLDCKNVIQRVGSWVLSEMEPYGKALKVAYAKDLKQSLRCINEYYPGNQRFPLPTKTRYNPYGANPGISISVDHLEVFIDKKGLKKIR